MQNMLQRWFRERYSQFWDEKEFENSRETFGRLLYQLWNVSKYGSRVDAAITCLMPPPPSLLELEVSQRYYCAITVEAEAVIFAYRLSVDRSRSIVGGILSKVVPATFLTITSISKILWRSDPPKRPVPKRISETSVGRRRVISSGLLIEVGLFDFLCWGFLGFFMEILIFIVLVLLIDLVDL